jgi:2-keto-4-pentenoate hydratase/2-oxohepta-3-ene-1,7-dioic acid hydratase in catechol pathway
MKLTVANRLLVREAGRNPAPFPSLFFKPSTSVHDHNAPVVIPKIAQDEQADYEGELVSRLPILNF